MIDDDSVFCRFCGKRQAEDVNKTTTTPDIKQEPVKEQEPEIEQKRLRPVDYQDAYDAQLYGINPYPEEQINEEIHKNTKPEHRIEYLNEGYEYNVLPIDNKEIRKTDSLKTQVADTITAEIRGIGTMIVLSALLLLVFLVYCDKGI